MALETLLLANKKLSRFETLLLAFVQNQEDSCAFNVASTRSAACLEFVEISGEFQMPLFLVHKPIGIAKTLPNVDFSDSQSLQ